jgi:hypothetical protein
MSTRERWIVYPLLFLALGTALRPKLAPTFEASIMQVTSDDVKSRKLTADRVTCRSLTIVDDQQRPRLELVGNRDGLAGVIDKNLKAGTIRIMPIAE